MSAVFCNLLASIFDHICLMKVESLSIATASLVWRLMDALEQRGILTPAEIDALVSAAVEHNRNIPEPAPGNEEAADHLERMLRGKKLDKTNAAI